MALGIAVAIAAGVYGRQAAARAAVEGTGEEVDEDLCHVFVTRGFPVAWPPLLDHCGR